MQVASYWSGAPLIEVHGVVELVGSERFQGSEEDFQRLSSGVGLESPGLRRLGADEGRSHQGLGEELAEEDALLEVCGLELALHLNHC